MGPARRKISFLMVHSSEGIKKVFINNILSLKGVFAKNKIRMRRKIIDDYRFKYLNNLFGIKLIILRSELDVDGQITVNLACLRINEYMQKSETSVSEFNKFEPRIKSVKNRFQLSAGLNLEKLNTNLSGTNHI